MRLDAECTTKPGVCNRGAQRAPLPSCVVRKNRRFCSTTHSLRVISFTLCPTTKAPNLRGRNYRRTSKNVPRLQRSAPDSKNVMIALSERMPLYWPPVRSTSLCSAPRRQSRKILRYLPTMMNRIRH